MNILKYIKKNARIIAISTALAVGSFFSPSKAIATSLGVSNENRPYTIESVRGSEKIIEKYDKIPEGSVEVVRGNVITIVSGDETKIMKYNPKEIVAAKNDNKYEEQTLAFALVQKKTNDLPKIEQQKGIAKIVSQPKYNRTTVSADESFRKNYESDLEKYLAAVLFATSVGFGAYGALNFRERKKNSESQLETYVEPLTTNPMSELRQKYTQSYLETADREQKGNKTLRGEVGKKMSLAIDQCIEWNKNYNPSETYTFSTHVSKNGSIRCRDKVTGKFISKAKALNEILYIGGKEPDLDSKVAA